MKKILRISAFLTAAASVWILFGLPGKGQAKGAPAGTQETKGAAIGGQESKGGQDSKDGLSGVRRLAAALWKQGRGSDSAVVFEFMLRRPTNACDDLPEQRIRLKADGRFTIDQGRSWAESEEEGPGRFEGRAGASDWNALFAALAGMSWSEKKTTLPMPGHSESHFTLRLFQGRDSARFDLAGSLPPGEEGIESGFNAVYALYTLPLDTLWQLRLDAAKAKLSGGRLDVTLTWRNLGRERVRIQLHAPERGSACGALELRWRPGGSDESGESSGTGETRRVASLPIQGSAPAWKTIEPGRSVAETFSFPLEETGGGKRSGHIMHLGMHLGLRRASRPEDTSRVTLFSGGFEF